MPVVGVILLVLALAFRPGNHSTLDCDRACKRERNRAPPLVSVDWDGMRAHDEAMGK